MRKLLIPLLYCSLVAAQPVFKKTTLERLGYPPGTKLLVLHANDLGMSRSVNRASFTALEQHAVSSASVMVPGPWFAEVAAYAKEHPEIDLGIQLTLTSEWKKKRWGPVSRQKLLSLTGPDGNFWPDKLQLTQHADPQEIEVEIRAQIDKAINAGIHPTHLDCHMATLLTTALFPVYVRVAREYGIPFLFARSAGASYPMVSALKDTDIVPDSVLMANAANNPGNNANKWKDFYAGAINSLKPGLTEIILHLGYDDPELRLIAGKQAVYGSAWRQRDFDVANSQEFQKLLKDNQVKLIGWKEIKEHWGK